MPPEYLVLGSILLAVALIGGSAYAAWSFRQPAIDLLRYQVGEQTKAAEAEKRKREILTAQFDRYVKDAEEDATWREEHQAASSSGRLDEWVLRAAPSRADAAASASPGGSANGGDAGRPDGVAEGKGTADA